MSLVSPSAAAALLCLHNQLRKLAAFHVTSETQPNLTTQVDSRNRTTTISYLLRIAIATAIVEGLIVQRRRRERKKDGLFSVKEQSEGGVDANLRVSITFSNVFTTGKRGIPRGTSLNVCALQLLPSGQKIDILTAA